jgi:predicted NACHT family NTPase
VLDMVQPIELTGERGIYTTVNVLGQITGRRRLEMTELLEADGEKFDRFGLNRITEKRVSGLEAVSHYSKLMVLGKPGTGKTTFLKYLALQCIEGLFQPDRVPIFITLKEFAETRDQPNLLSYITQLIDVSILEVGRALILLDGLDELRAKAGSRVLRQIRSFSNQFYTNQFVITCRIAAKEYTFEQFTEVEIADFDEEQINSFAQNWFRSSNPIKTERFIQKLRENQPLQELASNPLLLTLLCLVFGEVGDFPANRSELYKEGIDILLKRWDGQRNIMRDQAYKRLPLKRKENLLSQIAWNQFAHGNYFFTQKTVEKQITDYIRTLPDTSSDPASLHLDSEAILKAIEAQHGLLIERARGIYSFSHLTFQEYFAARHIVETEEFPQLIQHMMENRWQEVFLLVCAMLPRADDLLVSIKKYIDQILVEHPKLQNYLQWLNTKAASITTKYKSAAVRDLYFVHALGLSSGLAKLVDNTIPLESILVKYPDLSFQYAQPRNEDFGDLSELACDMTLTQALLTDLPTYIDYNLDYELAIELGLIQRDETNVDRSHTVYCACILALQLILARASNLYRGNDVEFRHKLEDLRQQLPLSFNAPERWWANNQPNWVQQLQTVMIEHRNTGHDWQFSNEERKKLQQYYDANNLLLKCLNSECYVSREVRQEIEKNILLPHTD